MTTTTQHNDMLATLEYLQQHTDNLYKNAVHALQVEPKLDHLRNTIMSMAHINDVVTKAIAKAKGVQS